MRNESLRSETSLATRLLRVVFGVYLAVALCALFLQMAVEYQYQKGSIRRDFADVRTSFESVLAGAIWNLDETALSHTVRGIVDLPGVVGVKIVNENGAVIAVAGLVTSDQGPGETGIHVNLSGCSAESTRPHVGERYSWEMFAEEFPIHYLARKEPRVLGRVTLYSNASVIWSRIKNNFLMLCLVTGIMTGLLGVTFLWVFNRRLKQPLSELTDAVRGVTPENLDSAEIPMRPGAQDELGFLAASFRELLGDLRDEIAMRRRSEEDIRSVRDQYQSLVDNIPGLTYRCKLDKDWTMLFMSDAVVPLIGYPASDFINNAVRTFDSVIHADDKDYVSKRVHASIANAQAWDIEYRICHKSGEIRRVHEKGRAVLGKDVDVEFLDGFIIDITARKRAEEALRESEAKLSALFASMTEMVVLHEVVFDEAGKPVNYRITDCNAAYTRITGIRREDAVGKLATEVYGTPEPPYLKEFAGVGITGEPYHYETYFAPMDKHFAISVVSPGANRFAIITTDVSEAKRTQAIIDAKNKELEQIVYVASHDLRSPLVNVDGFSRELDYSIKDMAALLDGGADAGVLEKALRTAFPGMARSLARIRTSTAQMDKLLKGLLHLSRQGRASLNIEDVDMNDCLARLAESFAFVTKEKGVQLRMDTLPSCRGDAVQITQVFANLIDNAIKYRAPDRPLAITVSGVRTADRVVYRVMDNGVGIAENHLEHIFELFHRLEPGKTEGEGLGLTVARQAVSRLNGGIHVESEVGKGSVFIVSLPPARRRDPGKEANP